MPNDDNYGINGLALRGANLMASRKVDRVQPSVPAEFAEHISQTVARGDWSVDPETGEHINAKGQTLEEFEKFWLSTRPHCFLPKAMIDDEEAVMMSGNATLHGQHVAKLEKAIGSKAAALVAYKEQCERWGVKRATDIGVRPGSVRDENKPEGSPNNPWSDAFAKRNTPEQVAAAKAHIMKTLGTAGANRFARAAGVHTLSGKKL